VAAAHTNRSTSCPFWLVHEGININHPNPAVYGPLLLDSFTREKPPPRLSSMNYTARRSCTGPRRRCFTLRTPRYLLHPSSFIHLHLSLECDAGLRILSSTYGSALCCHDDDDDDDDYHRICSLITFLSFPLTWDYSMPRVLRRLYELQYLWYKSLSSRALTSSPSDDTLCPPLFPTSTRSLLQYGPK